MHPSDWAEIQQRVETLEEQAAELGVKVEKQYGCIGCMGMVIIAVLGALCVLVWEYATH